MGSRGPSPPTSWLPVVLLFEILESRTPLKSADPDSQWFQFHSSTTSKIKSNKMSFQDLQNGAKPSSSAGRPQNPSQAVATGIFQINTAVAAFRRLVDAIVTAKDTPDHRHKLSVLSLSLPDKCKERGKKRLTPWPMPRVVTKSEDFPIKA